MRALVLVAMLTSVAGADARRECHLHNAPWLWDGNPEAEALVLAKKVLRGTADERIRVLTKATCTNAPW